MNTQPKKCQVRHGRLASERGKANEIGLQESDSAAAPLAFIYESLGGGQDRA
jgi:hypothetical protein